MNYFQMALSATALSATLMASAYAESTTSEQKVVNIKVSQFDQEQKTTAGKNSASAQNKLAQLSSIQRKSSFVPNENVWIFDSWVTLNYDDDFDGFYSEFSVEFDVDTVYEHVPVYAIVYLGRNDVFDPIHVSETFDIYGDSSSDSLIVDSELVSGFAPDDYEVIIEIYDAVDDTLLAYTDGIEDADLAFLSLESKTFEDSGQSTVVVVEEYGGSIGWTLALGLGLVAVFRRRQK